MDGVNNIRIRLIAIILATAAAACSHEAAEIRGAQATRFEEIRLITVSVQGRDFSSVKAYYRPATVSSNELGALRLIIVPGTPSDVVFWGKVITGIEARAEVYAIERPGYHGSGPKRAVTSLKEQASVIRPLIEDYNGRVILIGQSYGASVALWALDEFGNQIDGVFLVSPYVIPIRGGKRVWFNIVRLSPLRFIGGATTHRFFKEVAAHRRQSDDLIEIAQNSCTSIFIIHGEKDDLVPQEDVINLKKIFPECAAADVETIDGGDHYLSVHKSAALSGSINRFIERIVRSVGRPGRD